MNELIEYELARAREAERNKSLLEVYFEERTKSLFEEFKNATADELDRLQIRVQEIENLRTAIDEVINTGRMLERS
jgi:hypothetical protein